MAELKVADRAAQFRLGDAVRGVPQFSLAAELVKPDQRAVDGEGQHEAAEGHERVARPREPSADLELPVVQSHVRKCVQPQAEDCDVCEDAANGERQQKRNCPVQSAKTG